MTLPSHHPRPPQAAFLLLLLALAAVSPCTAQQAESIEFVQYDPSPSLQEEQPAGTLLTRFVVFYLDHNGAMKTDGTFSISSATGDHTFFTLDSSSGELRSAFVFDRDADGAQELFRLDITYTTPAGTSDSRSIIAIILDINDNKPSFTQDVFNVSVYEAAAAGSVFAAVNATDPDVVVRQQQVDYVNEVVTGFRYVVENGRIIYEIVDGNGLGHFTLDPDSGDIRVSEGTKLDYDDIRFYNFTVRARDGDNQTDFTTVNIHVLDSNDNRPIITGPFGVSVTIPEDTPPGYIIVDHINSTDGDHNANADITFSIIDGDPLDVFSIDSVTGRITTSGALDREFGTPVTLVAAAIDQGDPPLTGTVEVLVTLLDVNDSPPQFEQESYSATVSEAARVGTRVALISASDPDLSENGTVSYFIVDPTQPFSIDPSSGQVVTTATMDRESVEKFVVTVEAIDNSTLEELRMTSFVNLTVTVTDINDNFPYFDRPYFTANLLDSAPVGEEVVQLYALDDDFGSNAQIRWEVISGDTVTFQFDLSSGRVTVGADLRFETQFQFNYSLYAWDMGPIPNSNLTRLFITVHNENENPPVFDPLTYNVTLNESAEVNSVVLNVSAKDRDPSFIGEVRYRVISEFDAAGSFGVDPVTGEVFIATELDFDNRSSIEFQIEAYDGGFPDPLTDVANISVELLDVNDNRPSFSFDPQTFTFNVSENRPAGQVIVNIIDYIVDPDTGLGGVYNFTISQGGFEELPPKNMSEDDPLNFLGVEFNETLCNLTALNSSAMFNGSFNETLFNETFCNVTGGNASMEDVGPNYLVHFELDETTGVLRAGRSFDRETEPFITLQIMMWDFGSPSLTSHTNVTIRVLDQNDNDPYFASNFSGSIIEYNEIGEQFLTVTAFDDDIGDNARLTYSIYSGNELQRFAIHPDNGSIYAAARLNKTEVNRYVLGVMAIDNGDPKRYTHQIAYAEIVVLDFNDNPPVFPNEFLYASVPENSNVSTTFYQLQASDEDVGSNSELTYFLLDSEDSSRFALDPVSGHLATTDTFDAENETEILLTVVAMDMGRIPLTSTAIVVVTIEDVNDLEPYFLDDSYNATVIENSILGTYVITVQANDDDRDGRNSAIRYSLSGNRSEPFTIDELSGAITVDGEVDWEPGPVFDVVITASDTGMPSLSVNTTLTVSVVDVNDNPPVFDPASLTLGVREDLPMGTVVDRVVVDDADSEGNNSAVTFTIAMDFSQGRFLLDPNTGIVTATTPLNREQRDEYDILVRAVDHGVPPLYSEANVTIRVLDANDHRPQFVQRLFEGSVPENSPSGTPILTVEATDRDTGSNGAILYSLGSGTAPHFAINATSGVVYTANADLDFESSMITFTFTVVAEDLGLPALNTTATVRVTVTDVNDQPPVFSQRVYYGEVWENYAIGTVILRVNATDVDTGFGGIIRFSLRMGNGSEYFGIDEETGVLHTVLHVDHEVTPNVTLIVMATNPLAPINQVSTATVELTVLDMNDNHPTFDQSGYDILLPENTLPGEAFATVTAVDGDLGENGTITYSFISGNDRNIFQVDSATGQLSLLQKVDYEVLNVYTLGLMATDHSVDRLSNYTTLYIRVVDVNDNPPLFASRSSTVSISFGTTPGTEVVVLEARDADRPSMNQLTFSIPLGNGTHLFNITDSTVGRVETLQSLTSYAGTAVRLFVMVSDGMKEDIHQLMIEIIQTSQTLPVFSMRNYMGSVSEGANVDHSILDVVALRAMDYVIVSGNDEDIFKIDSFGTVSLAQSGLLDFENKSVYQLTVAGVNGGEMGYTLVTILVTDVNEFPPLFPHASYFVAVSESVTRGSPILQLSAVDEDGTTPNTQTVYSITMTTAPANTFRIDRSSGELRLNGRLDYELGDRNFTIAVEASNQIDPTNFKDSTTVEVLVLEDNDNSPTFDAPSYVFNVMEGSMVGMVIIDLNASDIDTGSNNQISFGLTGNHRYTDFVIDPHSGIVTIGAELDREQENNYILEVHGTDMGKSPQEGIVGVTINILDINDNSPIWESEQYHRTVFENVTLNTVLLTVRATDADQIDLSNGTEVVYHVTNGLVSYSITGGDPLEQFSIHNLTGVVMVTKPLDRETTPSYNLTLTASDGGGRYADAYLSVVLLDLNDSPPNFTMETYRTSVSEHTQLGEEFLTVLAIDPDNVGLNSNFTYAIQSGNEEGKFTLNDTTGVLSTAGFLDREATPLYNLTVIAVDFGSPPRTGTATVLVNILDENDSTPMFDAPSYLVVVPENTTIGSVILQVTAQDNDTGSNGAILYRLFAIATVAIDSNSTNESSTEATELIASATFLFADSSKGEISLLDTVDYETQTEYDVILVAYDSAPASLRRSSTAELRVVIEDVNDNRPVFAQTSYSASVRENSPPGTPVLAVNATDDDVFDSITYSIESTIPEPNPFRIIGNGTIISSGQLDRERYDQYVLQVRAVDTSSPPHDDFVTVTITVTDRNEHAPQFSQPAYITAVFENQPAGELLASVPATDADLGPNAEVSYQFGDTITDFVSCSVTCNNASLCGRVFVSSSPSRNVSSDESLSLFAINQYNGDVHSNSSYDREASDWYTLVVLATDQGTPPEDPPLSSSVCVFVEIVDLNDNPPHFLLEAYEVTVEENRVPLDPILILAVADDDIGTNTDTEFSIVSYTEGGGAFRLLPQGDLQLATILDREATPVINLTIMAANVEAPHHSSTAVVIVTVDDVNDNPPVFSTDSYHTSISENLPAGSFVITVTATDVDVGVNSLIMYSITSTSEGYEDLFTIDANSGNVSTLAVLDREVSVRHTLVITATDSGSRPLNTTVTLVINVTDTNDLPPVFSQQFYSASVYENVHMINVATILATDGDVGSNAFVFYFITSVSPITKAFSIDNSTGVIVLIQPLDAEEYTTYELTVTANNGPVTPYLDNNVTVTVTVEDRNDNRPLFDSGIHQAVITELAAVGSEVLTVTAKDSDILPENSQVVYFIDEGGFHGNDSGGGLPFFIHADNGTIVVADQLDFENTTQYEFDVVAMDTGNLPQSSSTHVLVFVQDSNDNFPVFSQPSYQFFIVENSPTASFIGRVSASDVDMGQLVYHIEYGDDSNSFQIDSQSGEIFGNETFDREEQSEFAFNVTVVDYGPDSLVKSATARVFVGILDQNDNPPEFDSTMYGQSVPENISLGSGVIVVTAFDPDSGPNGTVAYGLVENADASHFEINSTSGEIRTRTVLDRETQSEFSLLVEAADGGISPRAVTAEVLIVLTDINDNHPLFRQSIYSAIIDENIAIATPAIYLEATDEDIDENAVLRFSIEGDHYGRFSVNPRTGVISSSADIDYEVQPFYNFTAIVSDLGTPSLSSSVVVTVEIVDLNDNTPVFDQSLYNVTIAENNILGSLVFRIPATDEDSTSNGELRYTITRGNAGSHFALNEITGDITTATYLDREQVSFYEMGLQVVDQGSPQRTATATLQVQVSDENDNHPQFEMRVYEFRLSELLPGETGTVSLVSASDADSGINGQLQYSIIDGSSDGRFSIDGVSGNITAVGPLSFAQVKSVTLSIEARDGGSPSLYDTAIVSIQVDDVNTFPPVTSVTSYEVDITDNAVPGTAILYLGATDDDRNSVTDVTYTLTSGDSNLFAVDMLTGTVTVAGSLAMTTGTHSVTITLSDGTLTREVVVQIAVNPSSTSKPVFDPFAVEVEVPEPAAGGSEATLVQLSTSGSASSVTLQLPSSQSASTIYSNPSNAAGLAELSSAFRVDADGSLVLTDPSYLDRENRDAVIIPVEAIDSGTGETAYGTVTVRIVDQNDSPPTFSSNVYHLAVTEATNADVMLVLLRVSAYDLDQAGDNSAIMYSITNGNNGGHFEIDADSGDVKLVLPLDREVSPAHYITVRATNHQSSLQLSSEAYVSVTVLDDNDNTPAFTQPNYHIELLDTIAIGTEIFYSEVHDPDEGLNSKLVFSFTYESHPGVFELNASSGAISTAQRVFPQPTTPGYEVTLDVADRGFPVPHHRSVCVFIDVFPVNTLPPVFSQDVYLASIPETVTPGSDVAAVTAIDGDTNTSQGLSYLFVSGNEEGDFFISPDSGGITTTTELDFLRQNFYSLVITATDNGRPVTMTATATVNITVMDINNHVPQFSQLSYSTIVMENVTMGTTILRVQATDVDAEAIIYIISRNSMDLVTGLNLFAINSTTGEIFISTLVDFEQSHNHQLTVSAVDTGYPTQRSNNVPVSIAITDLNDVAPEFSASQYPDAVVYRLQQAGTIVTMVTATDPDTVGGPVSYSLQSGDSDNLFSISSTTGDITVSREIPEVTSSTEYVLVVKASDGILMSTATVKVDVLATGTYCEADFCTEIVDRHRERCPDGLSHEPDPTCPLAIIREIMRIMEGTGNYPLPSVHGVTNKWPVDRGGVWFMRRLNSPSPTQSPSFTAGGELCIRYFCTSVNTYPCLSTRTCVANGYSCVGTCPSGESVCPTTDLCHSVTLATTCDGSAVTCLEGQVLVQKEDSTRECAQPLSLPAAALSCVQPGMVYCSLLDQCSLLTAPHLCQHCSRHLFYCPTTDNCLPSEQQCCSSVEYYCEDLAVCLPNGERCELPNIAPRVEQGLFLAEVVMSFNEDTIYSSDGYVVGLLLSSANQTATDSQGEELGVAITEVQDVPLSLGEWQFVKCEDDVGDMFGFCSLSTSPWQPLPTGISQSNAFLLPPDSRLRFVRKALQLEGAIWLRVKLWDGNKDGYLSPEQNLTRSQNPHFESTLPFTANGAFSEDTTLVTVLLHPETTSPEFQDVGVSVQLSAINEEEVPLYNQGNVLEDVVGDVQLIELPVLDDFIIGGFPSVPPQLNVSQYQALLPTNIMDGYFEAVAKANPSRRARAYATAVNQEPGVAVSFTPPISSTPGRWQVSGTGSTFDWTYLDDIVDENTLVLLNISALIRFIPSKDFHGNVSIRLQPWDGYWNDTIATVTPGNYIMTSSLSNQSLSLNSAIRAELEVTSVEEAPIVLQKAFQLDPIPYSILYSYERLFTLEIEQSVAVLRQDQGTIAQLLQVALGHAVKIQRFLPTSAASSLMSFSITNNALMFSEVVSKVNINAATLESLIGPVLDISRDAFYSPGAGCYNNSSPAQPLHGTQVQQVMDAVATDDDSNVLGMAVIGSSNGDSGERGVWQYCRANYSDASIVLQNGVNAYHPEIFPWVNFPGNLSETGALLLRPQDRVRFVPRPNYFWSNSSKPHIIVKAWDLSLWQPEQENGLPIEQGYHSIDTDPFSSTVRSLASPVGRFSSATVLVSVSRFGCDDIIGSGLIHNPCCICGENGNGNVLSCDNGCGSDVIASPDQSYDSCDVCGGHDDSCLGCDLVPFSESTSQECAVCLSEVSIPTSNLGSVQYWNVSHLTDCSGTCFGTAIPDRCGMCSGGTSGHDSDMDCSGSCFGGAISDDCDYCTGGSTGLQFNQFLDCSGTCGGPFVEDCGVCYNPTPPTGPTTFRDCTGECFGKAQVDVCGVCFGGSSLVQLANSTLDACGVCDGDNSSCVGCDGITASGKMTDSCGHCDGNECGCLQITSATPLGGPDTGGTVIQIRGAGFFINVSALFNPSLPNCGTPTLLPDRSPIPVDCFFRSKENQQQFQGAAHIVNHSTILCSAPDTSSLSETFQEFEILVRVNRGAVLMANPPIIFQASDYSNVDVFSITPVDAPLGTTPTITFAGVNFINSSDIGCLIDFSACSPAASGAIMAVGTFLSSTEILCQLPPSDVQCTASIQLSLNGQASGIVPRSPLPAKVFDFIFGGPPPVVLSVHFSADLQRLMVSFDTSVELVSGSQLSCAAVFAPETLVALGNEQAQCSWSSIDQREITITLPSVATVTDGTEIVFLDDVIITQAPEDIQNYRRIPIRNVSVPVNGSVNRVIPIAVIEGQPNIPNCSTTIRFHGDNSLYPGYRALVYTWSIHVHDTSIQGYRELVKYLSNLPTDLSTLSFSSEFLRTGVEYYLRLVVQNTQGHFSEPDWLLLTRSSQWDTLIDVQIQGLSNRSVTTTDDIFLLSQISIPDCLDIESGYEYKWSVYKVVDAVRGTRSEAPLVGVELTLPTIFVPSIFLEPLETYIFILQVDVTGSDMTGSDNVTITVEPRGPVARIFGGDHRSVFQNRAVVLDATPSLVHSALGSPAYTWTCSEEVTQQPCYNQSRGVVKINSNNVTITIPAETLKPGSYRFNVVINQGGRQSSAATVIQVEGEAPGNKLLIGISPIDVTTATSTVVLEGWVYTDVVDVIAEWRLLQEPGYGFINEANIHKLRTPRSLSVDPFYVNRVNFAIGPRALEPGVFYLFELRATGGGVSGIARVEVRADTPPLLQEVQVDPPTGESLLTVFTVSATGENVDSKNLPLVYRYGIQNGNATFWLSGEIPSPSIRTILPSPYPSQNTSLQIVVGVRDSSGNEATFSSAIKLHPQNISAAEALDQIQMRYTRNGNWIESLASLGSYLYSHSAMGITLDDGTVGVVTEILFNISAISLTDTPTHHQLIAQYLSALTRNTESLSEPIAEKIAQLISETLMERTFETMATPIPVVEGITVDDLNFGTFSGAQFSPSTDETSNNLAAIEHLMGTFPTSSYLKELYPELLDVVSSGACSLLSVGEDDAFLATPNTQLAVRKVSPSQLGGVFKPCPSGVVCSSIDIGQSFGPALRQQICNTTEGRTLQLCEEVCLQGNQQMQGSGDVFELADLAKNKIMTDIPGSEHERVRPFSEISSFSVPILSAKGNGYAMLSNLNTPITVYLPVMGTFLLNDSQLLCLYRQRGGGGSYANEKWLLDNTHSPAVEEIDGIQTALCQYNHLTEFILGILPIPITPSSSLVIMSSTPPLSTSMATTSPSPSVVTPPSGGAAINPAAVGVPVILILIIVVVAIVIFLLLFFLWRKWKKRSKVGILDEAGPSGEVAEEEVKTEDHRVSKNVIALLDEGKRELFGSVLVLPNARLRAVREAIAGTFEEKLQKKPFYTLTTDFVDIEPAVEPFKYLNIVYSDTIFIRVVYTHTETTLRHFCPCGKASAFECSQCTSRGYCGTDCQLEDWEREHGKECKRLAEKRRRTEVLGRRAAVPTLGTPMTEQPAGLVTPTSSMGRTLSRGSVQDWRALLMSQRQASTATTFRPLGALTPIEEHPRPSQPPPTSEDTDVDGTHTLTDRETLTMKPPPKMADPFTVPGKPPSAPSSVRRLPPIARPSHITISPPGSTPSLLDQPMKPHDAQSYYWNRFKANTRKDVAQLAPPVKQTLAPRDFVPPQPLEPSPPGFTPMGATPGASGVSPRALQQTPVFTRPPGQQTQVFTRPPAIQTPAFTRPPMVFSRQLPLSRGLSIHSVTSEDFESSLNASQLRQSLRGEAVLEEGRSATSDSDSSTESSSEEESEGQPHS